jgi:hypothetical protein
MTNANCISTISGQDLQASGGHAGAVIIFNPRESAAAGAAASLPGFRRATRNAQPKRRHLIFSLLAVLAFVSIHPWKKVESASKSEISQETFVSQIYPWIGL